MPVTFTDAPSAQRKEQYFIDPREVVVDPGLNARHGPLDMEHVRRLAQSFLTEGGQQVPVQIRKEAGRAKLVAGYHRHAAALLINTELQPDNPVPLKCVLAERNDAEAFRDSIIENRRRKATNAIDDAHNQRRLREVYGYANQAIADLYDTTPAELNRTATLLELPAPVQRKIADRELPVCGALALAELPPDERDAALASATNTNGKVRAATIRAAAGERRRENGQSKARIYSEVRDAFAAWAADEHEPAGVRAFAKSFGRFCAGSITEKQMSNALRKLCES